MNDVSAKPSVLHAIIAAFGRYHLTIFIVVFAGGLVTAVLMLNAIMAQSSNTAGYTSPLDSTTFDQTTIDRITQLKSSSDTSLQFTLPTGRSSPFAE